MVTLGKKWINGWVKSCNKKDYELYYSGYFASYNVGIESI